MVIVTLMVRMIIKQGMPVDVKDKRQMTAMHHAISGMTSFSVTLDIPQLQLPIIWLIFIPSIKFHTGSTVIPCKLSFLFK